jgi:Icc protein
VLLAHLSDTHLLSDPTAELWGHNTTASLVAVMEALPQSVDVMVLTGDISEDGATTSYERAQALTEGRAAHRHFLAGNHDNPEVMGSVVGPIVPFQMAQVSNEWTLALVNSHWVGHDAGRVGIDALAALRHELANVRTDVIMCLHHPPVSPCDNPECGLANADEVLAAITDGPVRVVLSGHVHQAFDTTIDGVRFLGAPSTFRQLRHGGDPHYQDTHEPPAAQLIELLDNGRVLRHVVEAHSSLT